MGEKRDQSKVTLVYGQMNEPPGARARVALTGNSSFDFDFCSGVEITFDCRQNGIAAQFVLQEKRLTCVAKSAGLTVAEYFRDQGQDVLLFVDNIFRFTQVNAAGCCVHEVHHYICL